MITIDVAHPDIEEFITVKQDLKRINGANLSVCVSDAFMEAVKNDGDWELGFPDLDDPEYQGDFSGALDKPSALLSQAADKKYDRPIKFSGLLTASAS